MIRNATVNDAEQILGIYREYILNTAITFEYDVPTVEEFRGRIRRTLEKYPYIVLEEDGQVQGYAYAGSLGRIAYQFSAELSIYLASAAKGKGYGAALYAELERRLGEMGITNLYAAVAAPCGEEDEYLTFNSCNFHEHLGFRKAGEFYKCGYKFGNWYNMTWYEKVIGEHTLAEWPLEK